MQSKRTIVILCVLMITTIYGFCESGRVLLCEETEIYRKPSPDNYLEIVATRENCGATVSFVYNIYIVKNGEEYLYSEVFRAIRYDRINAEWISNEDILISYNNATIINSKKKWSSLLTGVYTRSVHIKYEHI